MQILILLRNLIIHLRIIQCHDTGTPVSITMLNMILHVVYQIRVACILANKTILQFVYAFWNSDLVISAI